MAGIEADLPGLWELSRHVGTTTEEVAAVVKVIDEVPAPTVAAYGWQPTVEAMQRMLSAWSTEVDLHPGR